MSSNVPYLTLSDMDAAGPAGTGAPLALYINTDYVFGMGCDSATVLWDRNRISIEPNEAHRFAVFVWAADRPPGLTINIQSGPEDIGNALSSTSRKIITRII